ncbi:hypothetical protein ASG29_12755 [Sphingomonas sp. Leaf412]|uniref:PEPxxWA-CTERM sorting domain-containing protein n=1 Tax=Sphingomonas sp. Leaf412 TaxID=1736370 RepID=UPI0006FCDEBA|nr:PEPxxWA-CTERM sorting domain-containing protein [Sphingomonas sp. Leaf412]KQT32613.1 hypothetical protein ASG29_12755 [Sphingomonas sp. Leaf412]
MFTNKLAIAAATLLFSAAGATGASAATLTTPLAGGNGQSGIMFDVTVGSAALTLQSLGINVQSGTYTFEFYTIDGGIGANTSNASAWTLRNTLSNVIGAGAGNLTGLDISDFGVAAGSTIGLYITTTGPTDLEYTNGTAVGDVVASDGALSILTGYGKAYPFAATFSPRNFNGSITYALAGGVPEPTTWALMILGMGAVGGAMRRRSAVATRIAAA